MKVSMYNSWFSSNFLMNSVISASGAVPQIAFVAGKCIGCAAAIASSSVATEMVKGKTIEEALQIKNADVVETLEGLPPQKIHCSVLAEEAIHAAIADYKAKQAK